jgi:hypothetical protein
MTNRIKEIQITAIRVNPAEAEVFLSVQPEHLTSATQVIGRLMGPRCAYASTVEVAYPLREHSRRYESEDIPRVILRVIIPEPNLWEPETPFLYQGPIELWQGKERCEMVQLSQGLRTTHIGPKGLRINTRPLLLRGISKTELSQSQARSLHQAGYNTLVVSAGSNLTRWQEIGDQFGFFVIGRIQNRADLRHGLPRNDRPCWLGWLARSEFLQDEGTRMLLSSHAPLGVQLAQALKPLPGGISFVACDGTLLPELVDLNVPKILLRKQTGHNQAMVAQPELPSLMGSIEE